MRADLPAGANNLQGGPVRFFATLLTVGNAPFSLAASAKTITGRRPGTRTLMTGAGRSSRRREGPGCRHRGHGRAMRGLFLPHRGQPRQGHFEQFVIRLFVHFLERDVIRGPIDNVAHRKTYDGFPRRAASNRKSGWAPDDFTFDALIAVVENSHVFRWQRVTSRAWPRSSPRKYSSSLSCSSLREGFRSRPTDIREEVSLPGSKRYWKGRPSSPSNTNSRKEDPKSTG